MRKNFLIPEQVFQEQICEVEDRLKKLLQNRKPQSLYEPCSYILQSGGKRLRPFLVLISAAAVGGKFNNVYNAACAVEILHNFTLAHDDIMDNSEKRRGRMTLHKKYDVNTAILAGDNLIALAYESLLMDCKRNVNNIVSTFTQAIVKVCEGQSLDKEFETKEMVSIKEYKEMIYKKTAALLEMCCSIGTQICSNFKKYDKAVSSYGKYLGMAFQIQDDLLDITANEKEFGKIIGSDLTEGKKTFLFLRAVEKSKRKVKDDLLRVSKQKGIDKSEVEKYKQLYFKLGVISDAEQEIVKYTKLAISNLKSLPNNDGKNLMYWLANSLINRIK